MAECILKQDHIYAIYKRPTSNQGTHTGWKWGDGKDIPCKWKSKENRSNNTHIIQNKLLNKDCYRDKGHYIMIKWSKQEDITIVNIQAPNIGVPQYRRQILLAMKGEIDRNTILVEDINIQEINSTLTFINGQMMHLFLFISHLYS